MKTNNDRMTDMPNRIQNANEKDFLTEKLSDYLPNYIAHSKSVDDDDPIPMNSMPRGYVGVSTVWEEDTVQPKMPADGSNRTVVVETANLVVINSYLPCRGSYSNMEYKAEIDQLAEICEKYSTSHLILTGDYNVDLHKSNDARVKYFKKFLATYNLAEAYPLSSPTFKHHNGQHCSKIDFIFMNESLRNKLVAVEYKVLEHDPANTSSHEPLLLKLHLEEDTINKKVKPRKKWIGKPLWHKCDVEVYETSLINCLETEILPSSPDLAVEYLIKSITKTTKDCVPFSKFKPRKKPWNPHIAELLKESKKADALWKGAEKPPPPNELFVNRKAA